jgi:predicted Co/Zn/Cd cation transporter (cation efflux family)
MKRNLVTVDAVMTLVLILLIVQIWLFSATLQAYLAGHRAVALPAALVSLLLFAACAALLGFLKRGANRRQ